MHTQRWTHMHTQLYQRTERCSPVRTASQTHLKTYTCQHTDGYTQRHAKILIAKISRCTHSYIHTNTHTDTHSSSHFPGPAPQEALGKEKQCESLRGRGKRPEIGVPAAVAWAVLGMGGGEEGLGPVYWALPAVPKQTEWQGGGHCHILSASGSCQSWHGL